MNEFNSRNRMSDIEEENMLPFHTGIEDITSGFSKNPNSKFMLSANNHTNFNHYRQPTQHSRNLYHCERELSPMSIRSDFGAYRFNSNKYPSSHKSVLDCRSRSPLSLRSGDSVRSAIDITNILKCESFNTNELQMIKDLVCRKLRQKLRSRYEKNRNRYMVLQSNNNKIKRNKRKIVSSRESSNSPVSSDEDDENQPNKNSKAFGGPHVSQVDKSLLITSKSNIIPHTHLTMPIKKNMLLNSHKNTNNLREVIQPDSTQVCNENNSLKNTSTKDNPLLLQRFKETKTAMDRNNLIKRRDNRECCSSDNEGILSHYGNRKRSLNDKSCNDAKKIKLSSPKTHIKDAADLFKKPLMPKTKPNVMNVEELVISKAPMQPLSKSNKDSSKQTEVSEINENSMKSSFSKRKLFTQKVDLLSAKVAGDAAGASPRTDIDNKEKNKARKLVKTQSCLNRNVSDEEDNVLDLIQRIVPVEQINSTSSNIIKTNRRPPDDKCNSDVSGTFTDETVNSITFETVSKKDNIKKGDYGSSSSLKDCRVILDNIHSKNATRNDFQRSNCVKSFWDTDIESEKESETVPARKLLNSEIKGQFKDFTSSTLNTRKPQTSKNVGKVFTVQDLIKKRNTKKKTLTKEMKLPNTKKKTITDNNKKSSTLISHSDNKENINTKQNCQNKLESVKTIKQKKATIGQTKVVKESAFKNKPTDGNKGNLNLNKKPSRRSKSYNRNCSGCEDMKNYTQHSKSNSNNGKTKIINFTTKENRKAVRTKPSFNSSLNTSDSFNVSSRTRSKQQNENSETSKENISQLSDSCNITLLSLRPRKIIKSKNTALNRTKSKFLNKS